MLKYFLFFYINDFKNSSLLLKKIKMLFINEEVVLKKNFKI